jgi:hypothetical protein
MLWAGASAAGLFSAFGDQIRWGRVGLGAPRGQTRGSPAVDVVEDLMDDVGIGDVPDDPQRPAAERAQADIYFKDALQALRPGQRCGGRIVAVVLRFCRWALRGRRCSG